MQYIPLALILFLLPKSLFAAGTTLFTIMTMFNGVLVNFVRVGLGVAVVVFIWGIVKMILGMSRGEADKAIQEGKSRMIWGIVALFLIVSIWGVTALLAEIVGVTGASTTQSTPIITMP